MKQKIVEQIEKLKVLSAKLLSNKRLEKLNGVKHFRLQAVHIFMAGVVAVISFGVYLGYRMIVPYHSQPVTAAIDPGFTHFQAVNANQDKQSLLPQTTTQNPTIEPQHSLQHAKSSKIGVGDQSTESIPEKAVNKALPDIDTSVKSARLDKTTKEDKAEDSRVNHYAVNHPTKEAMLPNAQMNKELVMPSKQQKSAADSVPAKDNAIALNPNSETTQAQPNGHEPTAFVNRQSDSQTSAHLTTLNTKISTLEQQVKSLSEAQTTLIDLFKKQQIIQQQQAAQEAQEGQEKQKNQLSSFIDGNEITAQKVQQMYEMLHALTMKNTLIKNPLSLVAVVGKYAWLQNSKGVTQSITLGDTIDGYGEVLKIDDQKNEVFMSSGYIFK